MESGITDQVWDLTELIGESHDLTKFKTDKSK